MTMPPASSAAPAQFVYYPLAVDGFFGGVVEYMHLPEGEDHFPGHEVVFHMQNIVVDIRYYIKQISPARCGIIFSFTVKFFHYRRCGVWPEPGRPSSQKGVWACQTFMKRPRND